MNPPLKKISETWLGFWFAPPDPAPQWALIRMGTALMLLYVLFMRSFDLQWPLALLGQGEPGLPPLSSAPAFPLAIFGWMARDWWLWGVHGFALLLAVLLLVGFFPRVAALGSFVLQFSYAHHIPELMLGLDFLLITALFYLSLAPSSHALSVYQVPPLPAYLRVSYHPQRVWEAEEEATRFWGAFPARMLQLHLSALYLNSALARLSTDWISGMPLWSPRMVDPVEPMSMVTVAAHPWLPGALMVSLLLFELFYPVLVWVPRLRYFALAAMTLMHLITAVVWDLMPFNLLLILLNLIFVPRHHLTFLVEGGRQLVEEVLHSRRR